jgi:hypothetical protein
VNLKESDALCRIGFSSNAHDERRIIRVDAGAFAD